MSKVESVESGVERAIVDGPPGAIGEAEVDRLRDALLEWFEMHGRTFCWRSPTERPYVKILAEVLLQRTTAQAVTKVLPQLIDRYPDWTSLATAERKEVADIIRSLGLWRRRSEVLIELAKAVRAGGVPESRVGLEDLPGVGQYIASAVLLACHDKRVPLLDSNMARLLERYFGPSDRVDLRYDPYLQSLAHTLVDHPRTVDINWAVLDFAADVCRPRMPRCESCPVADSCYYAARSVA